MKKVKHLSPLPNPCPDVAYDALFNIRGPLSRSKVVDAQLQINE